VKIVYSCLDISKQC